MVAPLVAAAGISAASSLAGGVLGALGAKSANAQSIRAAKNAIQWRVEDAEKAGIHPLYALGANVSMPQAQNVFAPLSESLGAMGQDISRAVAAGGNVQDRTLTALQLERAGLENELLKVQIANARAPAVGPGVPVGAQGVIPGQGQGIPAIPLPEWLGGGSMPAEPGLIPAQQATDFWGEIMDAIYGGHFIERLVSQPSFRSHVASKVLGGDARAFSRFARADLPARLSKVPAVVDRWLNERYGRNYQQRLGWSAGGR